MSPEIQAEEVSRVKKFESGIITEPTCVPVTATIGEVVNIVRDKGISGLPVLDQDHRLVGIVTRRDLRFGPKVAKY